MVGRPFRTGILHLCVAASLAAQTGAANSLLIHPGDELHISILDMPEMEQTPRVTDAGEVPVTGIGDVHVADMTPGSAATAIHDRLVAARFLKHPQVTVVVAQYATQEVTLIGQFKVPGSYPIATPRPILDVLALGGGLSDVADRNVLLERHGDQNNPVHYEVSNNGSQALREQVIVNPGDTIVASKAGIVYVLGDVGRPGGYVMNDNESKMSLLEVIAMAGGAQLTAKLNKTRLIHREGRSEEHLALGDIQRGKSPDVAMAPGDIVYVPFSYSKNLLITSSAGIVGAAGAAAIYSTR